MAVYFPTMIYQHLGPKHTSGRWSLATLIGQPARLQHGVRNVISVLVGQYRSLATNDQKYVWAFILAVVSRRQVKRYKKQSKLSKLLNS